MTTLPVWMILVTACAPHAGQVPADPPCPVTAATAPHAASPSAELDEAAVKARSHDLYDAEDRMDSAAFVAATGPSFAIFEDGRFIDAGMIGKAIQARIDRHAPVRSREWHDERVSIGPGVAVFVGRSVVRWAAEADHPATTFEGWDTLVWVRDSGRWKVAHAAWTRAGIAAEKERWNETFEKSIGFKKEPNQLLVDTVKGKKPGAALDLLMGQGRNALYLASQGWKVTGVDISDKGLQIARETAAKQKLKLDAIEADVDTWDLGKDRWDLITMIYAGDDAKLVERVKLGLKKGGLFVLEYFHADSDATKAGAGGWKTGQLAQLFGDGFEIVRDEVVDDLADWSLRKQKLVRFVARKR